MDINFDVTNALSAAAKGAGFSYYEDFPKENLNSLPKENLCIAAVKSQSFSPRIYAVNAVKYAVEADFEISIRLLGKRENGYDYTDFSKKISAFLNTLGLSDDMIITKLSRGEIHRNSLLARLESDAIIGIKMLSLNTDLSEKAGA